MPKPLTNRNLGHFRAELLAWYAQHRRDLPWRSRGRGRPQPYRVWVSEVMLQQTRVVAVLEYYKRFLKRFPTLRALAGAKEAEVLAAWSGLGYYRRARMMHAAARQLSLAGGRWPRTASALRELPGIGRYTAAAIASICFSEAAAVVDGNVERVILRLLGRGEGDGSDLWVEAERLLDSQHPGDWNQAMMELGATVCLPKNARCSRCPVYTWCRTRGEHNVAAPIERRRQHVSLGLVTQGRRVRLVQRPENARLMASMWELPACAVNGHPPLLVTRHSITNTDYSVRVFRETSGGTKWFAREQLRKAALTGLTRKILRRLDYI